MIGAFGGEVRMGGGDGGGADWGAAAGADGCDGGAAGGLDVADPRGMACAAATVGVVIAITIPRPSMERVSRVMWIPPCTSAATLLPVSASREPGGWDTRNSQRPLDRDLSRRR